MNQKIRRRYEELAQAAGLSVDAENGALYGNRGGYDVILYPANASYPYALTASVSAFRPNVPLSPDEAREFCKAYKPVANLAQNKSVIVMTLKQIPNQQKLIDGVNEALGALTAFLASRGFQNCCQSCGRPGPADAYYAGGAYLHLCPDCFTLLQQNMTMNQAQEKQKKENVLSGAVGALLGSLIGVLCIVILSRLNIVAAISGIVMAVCTLKGYELLGGKLSTKGVCISVVLLLVMTFFGDCLDWAIIIASEFKVDLGLAFQSIFWLLEEGGIDPSVYWGNLALLYVFLLIGMIPTVIASVKGRRSAATLYRLSEEPSQL